METTGEIAAVEEPKVAVVEASSYSKCKCLFFSRGGEGFTDWIFFTPATRLGGNGG